MRLRKELAAINVSAKIRWGALGELKVVAGERTVFSARQAGRLPQPGEVARLLQTDGAGS